MCQYYNNNIDVYFLIPFTHVTCPSGAEPPSNIRAERDTDNPSHIAITWTEPMATNGITIIGYMIYWANGDHANQTVSYRPSSDKPLVITVEDPTEPIYRFTMVTLTTKDTLPSEESDPIYSET